MTTTIYELRNVAKTYASRQVLYIQDLQIQRGEILALVGPSGAGKSTLLRLLNFLEEPTQGTISFLGQPFGARRDIPLCLRRKVTTVFQRPVLLNRSVRSNVAFGLRLRQGWWPLCLDGVDRRVDEALEMVGLSDLADQRARTLSGGEAQRVALARAIVLEPEALLLDEPTANLDPHNVALIESIIRDLNRRRGTTIVVVTHNVFQARRLAHRAGLLLDGSLIELADSETFFEHPRDERTRAFVRGEMIY
ncbi:MAG: phosphate ABC transporter ATP-binding protein [Chloroflexi bacterium]|nr:phosphate ABC transporter ATP-binding protein [Chloroflexota bacterium]